jgi:putative tryptophan/tyrosine transport system substrate-binding protein
MARALLISLVVANLVLQGLNPVADAEPSKVLIKPRSRPIPRVVIVRKSGIWTYEKIIEEVRGQVRGSVRVLPCPEGAITPFAQWLEGYDPNLVLAIGQAAYETLRPLPVNPIIGALIFHHDRPEPFFLPATVPPEMILKLFLQVRPKSRHIALIIGKKDRQYLTTAQQRATALGLIIHPLVASSSADTLRLLRRSPRQLDGLWLFPDLDLLQPQVFQYMLAIQSRRRIPLLGATRRHTAQGALFSLDFDPGELGRQMAQLANQLLTGQTPVAIPTLTPQLSINLSAAHRLGLDLERLQIKAAKVFQ